MKAVVFHDVGDIRLEDVPEPTIQAPTDALVRITTSAICGTDLHMVRGTMGGMKPGTILGHEGVGIVEEVGPQVRNLRPGDRVVIPSTIACGCCSYCRSGYFAQCDEANPNADGTAFFGGPEMAGSFAGLQAEYARVPYANVGLVRVPEEVSDDQAILISDIFPTGYFGAKLAQVKDGDVVLVLGCGPVGMFAILSAQLLGAGRVLAVDCYESRLEAARVQGAEAINFLKENPVEAVKELTTGIGCDRVIDAVGVDAIGPEADGEVAERRARELEQIAPRTNPTNGNWKPGNAPTQALDWGVQCVAKAGTLSIVGVYPPTVRSFPIGQAMNRNLTIQAGNCNHRRYIPTLLQWTRSGTVDPAAILTRQESIMSAIEAYKHFDQREPGWLKVELQVPAGVTRG